MDKFIEDDFIEDIFENIDKIHNCATDSESTVAVKKALIDVTEKYKEKCNLNLTISCKIYGEKYKSYKDREWLYDIIIYSQKNDVFDEVYLVGESEWKTDIKEIIYDFEKLLLAKSKVRLMVYQVSSNDKEKYRNDLINIIEKSSSCENGDRYIFAFYVNSEDDNEVGWDFTKYTKGEDNI